MNYLPSNIAAIREKWRESQKVFGERFGMSHTNVGRYEAGDYEPTVSFCLRLGALSGISVERLALTELAADEIPALPIGEGGAAIVREEKQAVATDVAAVFAALAALPGEVAELRKTVAALERKVDLMDGELLRAGVKKR